MAKKIGAPYTPREIAKLGALRMQGYMIGTLAEWGGREKVALGAKLRNAGYRLDDRVLIDPPMPIEEAARLYDEEHPIRADELSKDQKGALAAWAKAKEADVRRKNAERAAAARAKCKARVMPAPVYKSPMIDPESDRFMRENALPLLCGDCKHWTQHKPTEADCLGVNTGHCARQDCDTSRCMVCLRGEPLGYSTYLTIAYKLVSDGYDPRTAQPFLSDETRDRWEAWREEHRVEILQMRYRDPGDEEPERRVRRRGT